MTLNIECVHDDGKFNDKIPSEKYKRPKHAK